MRHVLLAPALLALLLAPAAAEEPTANAERVGRIVIRGDDLYCITPAQLEAVGISDARRADVRRAGTSLSLGHGVTVRGEKNCVVFHAQDTAGGHSRYGVFEVWRLAKPAAAAAAGPQAVKRPRVLATDRAFGGLGAARADVYAKDVPVWYLGYAPPGQVMPAMLGPLGAKEGTPQRLVAQVYANWLGPVAVEATWNGRVLGRAEAKHAVGGMELSWTVPADAVPPRAAQLGLRNVSPPPPPAEAHDASYGRGTLYVDSVRLEGEATYVRAPRHALAVQVRPARTPLDPAAACKDAQHVILAVPALVEEARRLAAHRTNHGLRSAVVDVTHVYDLYGQGEHVPLAIWKFLDALRSTPDAQLAYVVLAGDATLNRTDRLAEPTIPAPMTRSKYNGATASDRLYVKRDAPGPEVAIGRLPFRTSEELKAYVDRLIRYETQPPAHASRRMLRFITSEGRFSPLIDKLIEGKFRSILARQIPAAYDIEVTYANPRSAFLWPPPQLSSKVIQGLNSGALFYTYVGHGFEKGFDTLRVGGKPYGILHVDDVEQVDIRRGRTSPIVFVLACTTAMFDGLRGPGIGEALLKRPNGPVAFWGSARICHPLYNTFVGQAIASNLGQGSELDRLGKILQVARTQAPGLAAKLGSFLTLFPAVEDRAEIDRLLAEGAAMYTLLGDPALKVAFPRSELGVAALTDESARTVEAEVHAKLPDGTVVQVSLETPRNEDRAKPAKVANPADPASFPTIRKNHALMNDRALVRKVGQLKDGKASVAFELPEGVAAAGLVVKAWCIAKGDVWQGAVVLE